MEWCKILLSNDYLAISRRPRHSVASMAVCSRLSVPCAMYCSHALVGSMPTLGSNALSSAVVLPGARAGALCREAVCSGRVRVRIRGSSQGKVCGLVRVG